MTGTFPTQGMNLSKDYMLQKSRTIATLIGFLIAVPAFTGQASYRFRSIKGLSQLQVNCILQDHLGFLWVGTKDGLNHYDGNVFTVFQHDPNDDHSISNNYVSALMEDRAGNLWVGTHGGLNRLDREQMRFERNALDSAAGPIGGESILVLYQDRENTIWIGMEKLGLARVSATDHYRPHLESPAKPGGFPGHNIRAIVEDDAGTLWVGSQQGLASYEPGASHWVGHGLVTDPTPNFRVMSLLPDGDKLWVGTTQGLYRLDTSSGAAPRYLIGGLPGSNESGPIRDLLLKDGELWLAGDGGIYRIDPNRSPDQSHLADRLGGNSDNTQITVLYEDRSGLMLIGTAGYGLLAFNNSRPFEYRWHHWGENRALTPHILAIEKTRDDCLWIGTIDGPKVWDPARMALNVAKLSSTNRSIPVWSIHQSRSNMVWLGTSRGLYYTDGDRWREHRYGRLSHDAKDAQTLPHDHVTCIYESRLNESSDLWIGTLEGLCLLNPETLKVRHISLPGGVPGESLSRYIRVLAEIQGNAGPVLWIGTENTGLFSLDAQTGAVSHFPADPSDAHQLSNRQVISLHPDKSGRYLWIGTRGGGLNRLDLTTLRFRCFRTPEGLPNDTIYGILAGTDDDLWLSTNEGLSRFNTREQTFKNFDLNDGLQGREFNTGAYFKDTDGTLYFGGTNGLTSFQPGQITDNPLPPLLAFTGFNLFNQPIGTSSTRPDSPLARHINVTETIALNYRQNQFSIQFTALDFNSPAKNVYAYKMEGFDDQWLQADSQNRLATYTNLDPGHYTFRLRGANSDGVWNDDGKEIGIHILPPPWLTWWAYTGYILAGLVVLAVYTASQKRQRNLLKRMVTQRTTELRQKNTELDVSLRDLQTLFSMVRTINREIGMEKIIGTVLEQGIELFPMAENAAFLRFEPQNRAFRYVALTGLDKTRLEPLRISGDMLSKHLAELVGDWDDQTLSIAELDESISSGSVIRPKSAFFVPIKLKNRLTGVLILASSTKTNAFETVDLRRLALFKEHVVTALIHAQTVGHLIDTQRALVEQAHQSGMAETATQVLHNLGNQLNSLYTSAQLVHEAATHKLWLERLERFSRNIAKLSPTDEVDLAGKVKLAGKALTQISAALLVRNDEIMIHSNDLQESLGALKSSLQFQWQQTEMAPHLEETNLTLFVEEQLETEFYALNQDRITLNKTFEPCQVIQVDRAKLRLMFHCLIENAREAIKASKTELGVIAVKTRMDDKDVVLEVTDNGNGIAKGALAKVYRQGYTTKKVGGGLGLHYTANTVKQFNGEIAIESDGIGKGSTITLRFCPLERPAS